ncbi:IclR family transcriptional regulator [Desulfallas sp. Bu1-1]|uniref:IclR family transcriptional regulator n=1 Tax=Desulfallas sp. Bu1-1 TaxID=2787620 RepID=UPI00189E2BFA|nr:IclR family transcriptional regulator [Desulfallas sp. Bu1-1]MBF7084615.1 IclR family transcriptional regulator [Desulfallas sp. Bu1-1]
MNKPTNTIKAVERVIDILDCFTLEKSELGISEISRLTGMYKSTAFRIVQTLINRGVLVQNPESKKFMLGFKVFELGAVASANIEIRKVARPLMEELGNRTRETINLSIEHLGERVCIEMVESKEAVRNFVQVGMRGPLHVGATGKVLLAFLPPEQLGQIVQKVDESVDREKLLTQLSEIRDKHYSVSHEERVVGATAVSAPVKDHSGRVVAALTVSGPSMRFPDDRVNELINEVKECALKISKRLGYAGDF